MKYAWRRVGEENLQLYHLEVDPHEERNVAERHPEKVAALTAAMDRWWDAGNPYR